MKFLPLLIALLAAPQDPPSPWRVGAEWTWAEGKRRLSAEGWDRVDVRKRPCLRLRFRHLSEAKPWPYGDLFVAQNGGDLLLVGYRIEEFDYSSATPPVLLPKEPAVGQKWTATFENGSMDGGEYRWHDAVVQVEGKERLVLPGGTFDTWKVLWSDKDDQSNGFRFWIAANAGILKIESPDKSHDRKPWTIGAIAMDLQRPDRMNRYPEVPAGAAARLDGLIPGLRDVDAARRGVAEKAIRELGAGAIPELRRRAAAEPDAEVRARLETVARSFSSLKVEARARKTTIAWGERLPVEIVLKNDGPEPLLVLPCLRDSTLNMGRKYPAIRAAVTGPDGLPVETSLAGSFWSTPRLAGRDFRRLLPGESLEVLAEGDGGVPPELGLRIEEPGTYTIRMIYDVLGPETGDWATDSGPPDEEALRLLRTLPRGRFELDPVKVTVAEKK